MPPIDGPCKITQTWNCFICVFNPGTKWKRCFLKQFRQVLELLSPGVSIHLDSWLGNKEKFNIHQKWANLCCLCRLCSILYDCPGKMCKLHTAAKCGISTGKRFRIHSVTTRKPGRSQPVVSQCHTQLFVRVECLKCRHWLLPKCFDFFINEFQKRHFQKKQRHGSRHLEAGSKA